jgi:hypothetical protein
MDGMVGLLIYGLSFLVVAGALYFAIERPCMNLKDRILGSRLKTFPQIAHPE